MGSWNTVVDRPYMSSADLDPYLSLQPQRQPVDLPKGPDWKQPPRGLDLKPAPGEVNLASPPRTPLDLKPSPAAPPTTATNSGFSPTGIRTGSPPITAPTTSGLPTPSSAQASPSGSIGGVVGGIGAASLAGAGAGIISFGSRLAAGQSLPQAAAGATATGVGAGIGTGVGAAIGTALLPGAGTAIGGAIGGAIGAGIGGALADALFGPTTADPNKSSNKKSWTTVAYFEAPPSGITVLWYSVPEAKANPLGPLNRSQLIYGYSIEENAAYRDVLKSPYPEYLRLRFKIDPVKDLWSNEPGQGYSIDPTSIQVLGAENPTEKKGDNARALPSPLPSSLPTSAPADPPPQNPRNPGNLQNFPKPQPRGMPHPSSQPNLGGNLPNAPGAIPVAPNPFHQAVPTSNPNQPSGGSRTNLPGATPSGSPAAGSGAPSTLPTGTPPTTPAGVRPGQAPLPEGGLTPAPQPETKPTSDPRLDDIFKQLDKINEQLALIPALLPPTTQKPLDADQTKTVAKDAVCETAQPDNCLGKPLGDIKNEASQASQAAKSADKKLDEVNAALNALDLALLAKMDGKLDGINTKLGPQVDGGISGRLGKVFDRVGEVLDKVKDVANKSWNALGLDRIVSLLTLAASIHNAMMLSRELGETLVETANTVVQAAQAMIPGFLKRPDGENMEIDIGEILKNQIEDFLKNTLGEDNYLNLKASWMKANRILAATANGVSAIRGMTNAITEGLESVQGCVSQGFNGIQREGLVSDKTWPWMNENPNFKYRGLSRFTNFLENTEDATSSIQQIAQAPIEFVSEAKELVEATTELKKAYDIDTEKVAADEAKKDAESAAAEVDDNDLLPG